MSQTAFEDRLNRIVARHSRMSLGVTYRINADGLVVPVAAGQPSLRRPLRLALLALGAAWLMKAALFAGLGEATYTARIALLAQEGQAGAVAAWAMTPDPGMALAAQVVERGALAWSSR